MNSASATLSAPRTAEQRDVVVIGAGPAGAITAQQLAAENLDVLLVERKAFPRRKVCGCCLNSRALAGLEAAGVLQAIVQLGAVELSRFELKAFGRSAELAMPRGLAVSRSAMDETLVASARASGADVRMQVTAHVSELIGDRRRVRLVSAESPMNSPAGGQSAVSAGSTEQLVDAKLVLVADGLGHPSLNQLAEFSGSNVSPEVAEHSRLGAGCELATFPAELACGAIHMWVGRDGYMGITQLETGRANLAAAFDQKAVRQAGGLAAVARRVCEQATGRRISVLDDAEWLGTPQLTRSPQRVALERLFVLGDAAGYVEPFTGEGMAGAIESALAVARLSTSACRRWSSELADAWTAEHHRLIRRRAWLCRWLARLLKQPWCVRSSMAVIERWPRIAQPLIRTLNSPTNGWPHEGTY